MSLGVVHKDVEGGIMDSVYRKSDATSSCCDKGELRAWLNKGAFGNCRAAKNYVIVGKRACICVDVK